MNYRPDDAPSRSDLGALSVEQRGTEVEVDAHATVRSSQVLQAPTNSRQQSQDGPKASEDACAHEDHCSMVYADKNMTVDHGMTMNYEKGIPKACVAAIMFQGMIRLGTPFS
jgi:hypothetical protein